MSANYTSKLSHFQDIFKSSEEIWNKKQLTRNEGPHKHSAVSEIFNATAKSSTLLTPNTTRDYDTNTIPANYNINSTQAIEGLVNDTVERTRLESERNFLNQHVFQANHIISRRSVPFTENSKPINQQVLMSSAAFKPLDTFTEEVFAKHIEEALTSGGIEKVLSSLRAAVKKVDDPAIDDIWEKIFAVCQTVLLEGDMEVDQLRSSKKWMRHVVHYSTEYLQNQFLLYMEGTIEKNLEQAQRGGIPGTLPLIEAFLNVAHLEYGKVEDTLYGKHPVWCVLFHTLRLGDYAAAGKVVETLLNVPSCSILVSTINNLAKDVVIDYSVRVKLNAEWHHEEVNCTDIFKRACYGILLDFDCMDVNDNIENWLWSKLISVKFDNNHNLDRFLNLQRLISVEYGEEWFLNESNGGSSLVYFSALLLSGQLERAIEILYRSDMLVFGTHLAVLSYSLKLLILTDKVSDPLFISDPADATLCKFNFARIVILYVKRFEMTNVRYALNYCFFLSKLQFDSSENGSNLFEACVSRLVYVSGQADVILGKVNIDGIRMHGLLDRFEKYINVTDVISRVALDTSLNGDNLAACRIYCLAGRANEAIKLMNRQLSICILSFSSQTEVSVRLAEKLMKRYTKSRDNTIQTQHLSTLDTLIRCYHIFRMHKENRFEDSLVEAEQISVVPFDPDSVSSFIEKFEMIPEEIRNLLPDLCLVLMKSTVKQYEKALPKSPAQMKMQKIAKAILLFAAMIPFRFPVAVNTTLLQLQAQVS
uniref:Nuclear pore protein n=1 Tax=Panagrolaimus superbus TaxID=310955 RepID=A0A914Z772_9BILA